MKPVQSRSVVVLGLGYVGCVTAACLADIGHTVTGVDLDERKVEDVLEGHAPFFEPGLDELVAEAVKRGRLRASTTPDEAIRGAEVVMVCVGTPSDARGHSDLEPLLGAVRSIAIALDGLNQRVVVAIRSTILPGTTDNLLRPILPRNTTPLLVHPEFMREGSAIQDFKQPSLVVVGGDDPDAVELVASLYGNGADVSRVALRTAEMAKHACNAFHAAKIGFANEIGTLAAASGVPPREVMSLVCRDTKLNISSAYLSPGFAFGGSCLPKDLRALGSRTRELGLSLPFLASILESNREHIARAARLILGLPARRLGIVGLAFKENTDDVRESPAIRLLRLLEDRGAELRVFDPLIVPSRLRGANRRYLEQEIPNLATLMVEGVEPLIAWADYLVVTRKLSLPLFERLRGSDRPLLDLTAI